MQERAEELNGQPFAPAKPAPRIKIDPSKDVISLTEEIYEMKKDMQALRAERDLLFARCNQIEAQYSALEKQLDSDDKPRRGSSTVRNKDQYDRLASGLKRQIREQQRSIKEKAEEIEALRLTQKQTRIEDLETEVTAYYEEALRLQQVGN
jgi:predicted RNase H-like nuclease (RuvC/YqgF family)